MFDETIVVVKNTCVVWSLVALHWGLTVWNTVYQATSKTVRAAFEINMNQAWVFTARNMTPWVMPEYKIVNTYPLVYYPESSTFVFNGSDVHSFPTVVIAELKDSEGVVKHDMSTFFHSTKWISNEYAPSLHELALVYFLTNDLVVTNQYMDTLTLFVMTSDGVEHKQLLRDVKSYVNFSGWPNYDKEE